MPDGHKLLPAHRLQELAQMAIEGAAEGALFELPCVEMVALLQHIETLGAALDLEAGDYCRVCGCTQNNACEGGCAWVDAGLCSSCRYQVQEAEDGDGWVVVDRVTGDTLGDEHGEVVYLQREGAEAAAAAGRVEMDPGDEDPFAEVDDVDGPRV